MKTAAASLLLSTWAGSVVGQRIGVLRKQLGRLERSPSEDAIHDVRVATRRLRAALRQLAPCFPVAATARFHSALRSVARLLGDVRDLDILLINLAAVSVPAAALRPLRSRLRRRRDAKLRAAFPVARRLADRLPALKKGLSA